MRTEEQQLLVNLLNLRCGACETSFVTAYRVDVKGLVFGSLLLVALVGGFWGVLRLT